ncbi:polysaccharide lyase 8 family protein [Chitinophaga horti]|uniref:Polysaccharide lyase 8 family protein n=1 Tax=Chitinophaga horti TaxID=2920382 RepID=A0ABY6IXH3_9BACT|nr:polysaccharide lyase 8 family protein [Chitinophaga horti]UYQ92090.1 polysaccharide lyase 8 family protein [Chitinophaga horti]
MKKLFIFLLIPLLAASTLLAQSEYTTILDRIRKDMIPDAANTARQDKIITSVLMTLQKDGSWADIDYGRDTRDFSAGTHLNRVQTFAQAYINTASTYHRQAALLNGITSALTYWDEKDPQSWNWYHNQIFSPQHLGEILILLEGTSFPKELRGRLLQQMERGDPRKWTGANKLDIATHYIYRACLTANDTLMQLGVSEAFYPIRLTTEEGIQHDYSYQQHGAQLYVYGYGAVFVEGETRIAYYLRGTSYALSGEQLDIFSNFVRNTFLKVRRGKTVDYGTAGRSISRLNALAPGGTANLQKLKELDPGHAQEYEAAIGRNFGKQPASYGVKANHTQYWRSDYATHTRPGYFIGVHGTSPRTAKQENGNDENLKGYYLSDGSYSLNTTGGEYLNIFPVWDWSMIPGTTVPYITNIPIRKAWGFNFGTTPFCGGVSDSLYGAAALDFSDYNTQARKAWFFFDEEVVCLGAGITSTARENIYTTVNQCLLAGKVQKGKQWFTHNGISYYFPSAANVQLSTATQTGDWYSINKNGIKDPQRKEVFKLWIDHGQQPKDASYVYYILPGQDMASYNAKAVSVLQNTADIQAVYHNSLKIWQVVFYKAGTFNNQITVDRPCVLMIRDNKLSIADPTQSDSPVQVSIQLPGMQQPRHITCNMPSGAFAGGTMKYDIR